MRDFAKELRIMEARFPTVIEENDKIIKKKTKTKMNSVLLGGNEIISMNLQFSIYFNTDINIEVNVTVSTVKFWNQQHSNSSVHSNHPDLGF